jgi:ABC-2 type transport system permease protein
MSALRAYRQGLVVGLVDLRDFWTVRSWLFGWLLRILTNAFAWVLLGRVLGSEAKVHYLLVGNAAAAGTTAAMWASNATTWSRYDGTHPLLVIAPGSLLAAVVGRTSIWFFNGLATAFASFLVLFAAFDYWPPAAGIFAAVGCMAAMCAATYGMALCLGAVMSNRSRYRNIGLDVASMLLMAFTGASVPVEFWPAPVQWLAAVLPMTHGLAAIRLGFDGAWGSGFLSQLTAEVAVAGAWLGVSMLIVTRLFNRGRADGSIELP